MSDVVREVCDDNLLMKLDTNFWYSEPSEWRGPKWNATVKQICYHFNVNDVDVLCEGEFKTYEDFDQAIGPIVRARNSKRNEAVLYKYKKAKWFQYLDPSYDNSEIVIN